MKLFFIFLTIFIISCGSGGGNAQKPNTQPENITFKSVPDNIGIFN
jgi:hypothetical protein